MKAAAVIRTRWSGTSAARASSIPIKKDRELEEQESDGWGKLCDRYTINGTQTAPTAESGHARTEATKQQEEGGKRRVELHLKTQTPVRQ